MTRPIQINSETTVPGACRQCEICRTLTKAVCHDTFLCHRLIISIPQCHRHGLICHGICFHMIRQSIDDSRHMDSLPRTINSTVGIEMSILPTVVILIEMEIVRGTRLRACLVLKGIGKYLMSSLLCKPVRNLALGIRLQNYWFLILFIIIIIIRCDPNFRAFHRLPRLSVHYNITHNGLWVTDS